MGWIRFLHFAAAAVLVATAIVRVYWLFAGNKFERWVALFPVRPRDWVNMVQAGEVLPDDPAGEGAPLPGPQPAPAAELHRRSTSWPRCRSSPASHSTASRTRAVSSTPPSAGWGRCFGGMPVVRFVHHVVTWGFLIFIPIHVYLATRADILERAGAISSIISGGRFVQADRHFVDE